MSILDKINKFINSITNKDCVKTYANQDIPNSEVKVTKEANSKENIDKLRLEKAFVDSIAKCNDRIDNAMGLGYKSTRVKFTNVDKPTLVRMANAIMKGNSYIHRFTIKALTTTDGTPTYYIIFSFKKHENGSYIIRETN